MTRVQCKIRIYFAVVIMGKELTVYYQNCGGIRTKLNSLYMNILSDNYDIIVLTETWLTPDIADSEVIDSRYTVYRCDRDRIASGRSDGGGVLVAVRSELRAVRRVLAAAVSPLVDLVLLELPAADSGVARVLVALYVPPNQPLVTYETCLEAIHDFLTDHNTNSFFILGDFNIPTLNWEKCDSVCGALISRYTCPVGKYLVNFIASINGLQYNSRRNVLDRTLDLFLTDSTGCLCLSPPVPLTKPDGHHPPFYMLITLECSLPQMARKRILKHRFRVADYEKINTDIRNVHWGRELDSLSADSAVTRFYEILYRIIKDRIPLKPSTSSKFPVWFSPALIHIYKNKNTAWTNWKRYRSVSDYEQFSLFRRRFKTESRDCYRKYIDSVEDGLRNNSKYFWKYIRHRQVNTRIPDVMKYNSHESNDPEEICNMFSEFFYSVYERSSAASSVSLIENSEISPCASSISGIKLLLNDIRGQLESLDVSKGAGPDGIPPYFIKNTADTICVPLKIIYQKCLESGFFPNIWKLANITPVYKSGNRQDVKNYRPISLLSTLSKVFERIVHHEVYNNVKNILIPEQHGFVKKRSTTSNLLLYTNYLFQSMDSGVQVDSVYTDFCKAFDKVDHVKLLERIHYNGIRGNLLRWFHSYIMNRTQKVVINGFASNTVAVTSGVPQGSILGPLLFILFINDIDSCFHFSKFLLYADDLKIYHTIHNSDDCTRLQQDLNRFNDYCVRNKLHLATSKCKTITFTKNLNVINFDYSLNGTIVERVTVMRDLGVYLDCQLHLNAHIDHITNKAFKLYGFVRRATNEFKNIKSYIYLFASIIRPTLEYAAMIWNPFYKKYDDQIESVQRKFLRSITWKFERSSNYCAYTDLLAKHSLLSLGGRRLLLESMTLYNLIHGNIDSSAIVNQICYLVPSSSARIRNRYAHRLFVTGHCRTNAGVRAPLRRIVHNYNSSFNEIDVFSVSPYIFKKAVIVKLVEMQ